jgi:hypothetical protein
LTTEPHLSESYRSKRSSSFFVYGWRENVDARNLFADFWEITKKADVKIHSVGFASSETDLKYLTPRNFENRLADGTIGKLSHLSFLSFFDKSDKQSEVFALSFDQDKFGGQFSELMLTQSDESARHDLLRDFLQIVLKYVSPIYGYSVDLPLFYAPGYFAHGMLSRTLHAEKEAHAWQEAYSPQLARMDHTKGKFRHVFLMNVVSSSHLRNRIGGKSFEDWVTEPGHGRLEQWKEDVWVWFVPREDRIRCANILQFNGLLTAPAGFENELIG